MLRLLARVIGVGIETADMLVQEVLANMRDRRAMARNPCWRSHGTHIMPRSVSIRMLRIHHS
jgi:hypothetical protein